ncbi:hypothetical protein BZM27_51525 [Paraburkholderia steynii]|uniref:Uncharacterized protein n=1 Tax=Paraburkholderia steynii TaxID=1245441 RepID=A0A4R0WZ90_9BURK|nr:hypothetical protein BZM27_51525 [Paraburkholderia steynii]
MSRLTDLSETIACDLEQSGFQNEANEVRRVADLADNLGNASTVRRDALKSLDSMAHVKWLGDLYLPHLSQQEWWGKLDQLKKATKSIVSKIES